MSNNHSNNYPKLHNAAWPGVVGKGPDGEPPIELDTMLDLTAAAEVEGVEVRRRRSVPVRSARRHRFHRRRAQDAGRQGPRAEPGDRLGRRAGLAADRRRLGDGQRRGSQEVSRAGAQRLPHRQEAARAGRPALRRRADRLGLRRRRVGRKTRGQSENASPRRFREACDIAEDLGERLAAEGEICWGGMHSWQRMVELLEMVDRPQTLGFQADMAHTLLVHAGLQRAGRRHAAGRFRLERPRAVRRGATRNSPRRCGPGRSTSTSPRTTPRCTAPARTTRPAATACPTIRTASSTSSSHAGYWLRDDNGKLTKKFRHICWDGCMFPNDTMMKPQTWNEILAAMVAVRR